MEAPTGGAPALRPRRALRSIFGFDITLPCESDSDRREPSTPRGQAPLPNRRKWLKDSEATLASADSFGKIQNRGAGLTKLPDVEHSAMEGRGPETDPPPRS
jgi:hypothetical protein